MTKMSNHEVFDKDERPRRPNRNKPREIRGEFHSCETLFTRARVTNYDSKVESEI